MWVQFLGQEDPLEKEMATHSSVLAWRIPWTEEPGRLQSRGLQKKHNWATKEQELEMVKGTIKGYWSTLKLAASEDVYHLGLKGKQTEWLLESRENARYSLKRDHLWGAIVEEASL